MKRENLKVEKRKVLGKQVKKLRREGIIPANVYGKDMKSTPVQVDLKGFQDVFAIAHETGLVDLQLEKETIPVLIHDVHIDPRTRMPLHADFFKVNLKEKITAHIPVEAAGEAKAETDKVGLLEQPMSEVEVEALPTDLPEKIEVDVTALSEVDAQITVGDLKVSSNVTIISDPSWVVFKIGELVTKEMEEQMAADEAASEEATAESAEGEESGEKKEEATAESAEAGGEENKQEGENQAQESQEQPKE